MLSRQTSFSTTRFLAVNANKAVGLTYSKAGQTALRKGHRPAERATTGTNKAIGLTYVKRFDLH